MIKTDIIVLLDVLLVIARTFVNDLRFFKKKFTSDELLELRKTILGGPKIWRHFHFFDCFLPIETKLYLGDTPDLRQYHDKKNLVIWTPTVYAQDNALIHQMSPQWYSLYFEHFDWNYQDTAPVKDFNCFINRMDVNRQSWLYLLIRRNLFDRGFVSFNMDVSRLDNYDPTVPSSTVFDQQFQSHMTNFEDEHRIARSIVPYRNFDTQDLVAVLMQSRFSIVLETYFAAPDEITFTEKTFRTLVCPRPWLLYAAPGAVKTLRNWGFDVLDDLVDHAAYDNVNDCIQRQTAILDLAETMCKFDVTANQTRLQQAATHNLGLLKQWRGELFDVAYKDTQRFLDKVYALYGGN